MKHSVFFILVLGFTALCGCTSEKAADLPQKIPALTLSNTDKKKLMSFQKDLLSAENLADKAVKLAGDELKNVIKGGGIPINLPSLIDKAKAECRLAGESLAKKTVPDALPPEVKKLLNEGKIGLTAAYSAYAESFDAIKRFVADKNPLALLEYRKKSAQAQDLYTVASEKFKTVMTAAGGLNDPAHENRLTKN